MPGSKSHTNRALVCAALAAGRSTLNGALFADDTEAMLAALTTLGLDVEASPDAAVVTVVGGVDRLRSGSVTVDARQSGTTGRFLLAALANGPGRYTIDGHPQLRARPFTPLAAALRQLGASVDGDALPIVVDGRDARPGPVAMSGSVSSQFLSALLLAAPALGGRSSTGAPSPAPTVVTLDDELVSKPYVELTIDTMRTFGVAVEAEGWRVFTVPRQPYRPVEVDIEPDASAASYFLAAAAITGGRVRIDGLGRQSVQGDVAFADALAAMGARVEVGERAIEVIGGPLVGIDIDMADISDTAQTLAVVATFATSPTRVRGVDFIEKKEIPRVSAVIDELVALGIRAERSPGGFTVYPGRPRPGRVTTRDDHRMAMSFALLGLVHPGIEIDDPGCVAKTFPGYFDALGELARR